MSTSAPSSLGDWLGRRVWVRWSFDGGSRTAVGVLRAEGKHLNLHPVFEPLEPGDRPVVRPRRHGVIDPSTVVSIQLARKAGARGAGPGRPPPGQEPDDDRQHGKGGTG